MSTDLDTGLSYSFSARSLLPPVRLCRRMCGLGKRRHGAASGRAAGPAAACLWTCAASMARGRAVPSQTAA